MGGGGDEEKLYGPLRYGETVIAIVRNFEMNYIVYMETILKDDLAIFIV